MADRPVLQGLQESESGEGMTEPEITEKNFWYKSDTSYTKLNSLSVAQSGKECWTLIGEPNPNWVVTSKINLTLTVDDLAELRLIRQALDFMEDRLVNYRERTIECPFCGGVMKESWNERHWFKCQNLPKCHTMRHEDEIMELLAKKKKE